MSDHDTQQLPPISDAGPTASTAPPTARPWESPRPGNRAHRGYALVAATALVAGALGAGVGSIVTTQLTGTDTAAPSSQQPPRGASGAAGSSGSQNASARDVAATVLPSVVSLRAGSGSGSGVILSADGLILTNNHVVDGMGRAVLRPDGTLLESSAIEVNFNDGRTTTARLVGTDPLTDLAVVKAENVSGLTPAKLGNSEALAVGDRVLAVGSPLGLSGTVTEGIVSALDRPVRAGDQSGGANAVIDAIQTDAAVNPGNSGGALVNMAGEVVGINSAIATIATSPNGEGGSIGLGFAIPIDQAKPIADELADGGKATHARIGVGVRDSAGEGEQPSGALLANVEDGSPAAKAGLRSGDVVTKLGDRRITGADGLIAAVRSHRPGETVSLTYVRDGKETTVEVQLASDSPST